MFSLIMCAPRRCRHRYWIIAIKFSLIPLPSWERGLKLVYIKFTVVKNFAVIPFQNPSLWWKYARSRWQLATNWIDYPTLGRIQPAILMQFIAIAAPITRSGDAAAKEMVQSAYSYLDLKRSRRHQWSSSQSYCFDDKGDPNIARQIPQQVDKSSALVVLGHPLESKHL
jgi:hypothetical protein